MLQNQQHARASRIAYINELLLNGDATGISQFTINSWTVQLFALKSWHKELYA